MWMIHPCQTARQRNAKKEKKEREAGCYEDAAEVSSLSSLAYSTHQQAFVSAGFPAPAMPPAPLALLHVGDAAGDIVLALYGRAAGDADAAAASSTCAAVGNGPPAVHVHVRAAADDPSVA